MWPDDPTCERRDRGDEDHPSPVAITHTRSDPLRQQKGGAQVDVHGLVPLLPGDLFQALAGTRASVTDQNIGRAELGLRRINQGQHLGWLTHVPAQWNSAPPYLAYVFCEYLRCLFLVSISKREIGSRFGQAQSSSVPDPAPSSGDQGDPSAKIHEELLSLLNMPLLLLSAVSPPPFKVKEWLTSRAYL